MITEAELDAAMRRKAEAEEVIQQFAKQTVESFEARWEQFERGEKPFKDEELIYSAGARCACGAGLAYPKNCGIWHKWDCSKVLRGEEKQSPAHSRLPFAFFSVISEQQKERAKGRTTRPQNEHTNVS